MKSRRLLSLATLGALLAAASLSQDPPKPPDPHEGAAESKKPEKEKPAEEKKWDVEAPPYPMPIAAALDTDEGTWMSVDVSADGREIIFDLLGDIYAMPFSGGDARPLTSGVAWDMQPRFSPDGRRIAFTSDRSGGDNVWIMDRDGGNSVQVTKENFRLPNSPVWTPDGDFIAARKHFTSTRSLGAGEIWLYHRSGGEGLQMTKRANDQKDVGEPAFSPDGRYLYYSQDVTPGKVFEYNKDPYGQIYVIQRLDRVRGEIQRFVAGSGGSIRPTPSPDGKRLAFIRRVGLKTVLYAKDLDSGRERAIADGLDRDMQETWAVHGVYPGMAWTPDSRSVVFWAGGKIRRADIGTREVSVIPFRVRSTRKMAKAVRFPVPLGPERFPVKMLRFVQVSPVGGQVLYEALGHIYVRDLPEGAPGRLTRQTDHRELYPSYSRDGRSIVYATWDDEQAGSIRVAPARGGEGRVVTEEPGHYVEPVFSPDGSRIVFRRVRGGFTRTSLWSGVAGLYFTPASGGKPVWIVKEGILPQFGSGNDRVYFMKSEEKEDSDEEKRVFMSVDLDGSDERAHLVSESATEFRLSPDEKWVAFREGFQAFIAPFVGTGKRIEIGPKAKAFPVARVSKDAGEYLHWSGDGRRLHWSLGPELFTGEIKETFAFLEGAPEKLPDPPAKGKAIGFETAFEAPPGSFALVGARIVTMKGDEVIEDGAVLVARNRIAAVGRRSEVKVPAGARVLDVSGQTILPGFIDAHWHGSIGQNEIVPERSWVLDASLAFGVTTIHDPSHDTTTFFAASEMARAGLLTAPRLFSTGTILYGAAGDIKAEIDSLEDARSHLKRLKAVGAFSVKSYNQPRREQRQQVLAAARELQMMVVPEGGSLFQHNMNMVVDGHTGIEHSIPVGRIYKDVVQLWEKSDTGYTPTLVVGYGGLWGENYWYQHTNVFEHPRLTTFVPGFVLDPVSRRRVMAAEDDFNHIGNARVAKRLQDAGVSIQLGAHGQREGLAAHWELWSFVQGGMTPHEALRCATRNGAAYLGLDGDIGSLEPGKLADLIVVDGNPLTDIRQSEKVRYTVVNGRIYDAATMDEAGGRAEKRPRYYWEE